MVLHILRSRKFAKRTLILLLILIIPAFVLWGVGGLTRTEEPIGKIGGQQIYHDDFTKSRKGIQAQILFAYYGDYNAMNKISKNRPLINLMAWERLVFLDVAHTKKVKVSNDDVLLFISQQPVFQRNGVFDKEAYNYILRNNLEMGPRQFEELVRENLRIHSLRQSILKDITVGEDELKEQFKVASSKVEFSYILIDKTPFRDQAKVSIEETKEFYDQNKDKFLEPAKVQVEYIEFPYKDAAERASVTGKIEEIYPELKNSPSQFLGIAKQYDLRCGTTEPFSRKDVIPGIVFFEQFPDTAFKLKEGEMGAPIFSSAKEEKGTAYLLRKIKAIPPKQLTFQEVWGSLTNILADNKSVYMAGQKAKQIYEKMVKDDTTLEEEALALNLQIQTSGVVSSDGYIENIGPAKVIVAHALQAGAGNILPPLLGKRGAFLARVDNILPGDVTGLAAKKEVLRKYILSNKQAKAVEVWLKENAPEIELKQKLEEL